MGVYQREGLAVTETLCDEPTLRYTPVRSGFRKPTDLWQARGMDKEE